MNKILIIPDIHSRLFWKKDIEKHFNNVDKVIFLGDYIDPYINEAEKHYDSNIECLKEIINFKKENSDKVILLLGNHIDHYIWDSFPRSTRYDKFQCRNYEKVLSDNLDIFNIVWVEKNVIFSHAGITEGWMENCKGIIYPDDETPTILEFAQFLSKVSPKDIDYNFQVLLGKLSYYRGGYGRWGSCEWADILEHTISGEPVKYENIYQVFGHSQLKSELITDTWACLDCRKSFLIDIDTYDITKA